MNSVHSLSSYICMKEKLFTYYKIRMAPLILFTRQAIFSACEFYWLFCRWIFLAKQPYGKSSAEASAFVVPLQSRIVLWSNADFRHHGTAFFILFPLPGEWWQCRMVHLEVEERSVKKLKQNQKQNQRKKLENCLFLMYS